MIHTGDCVEVMAGMPADSVDAVVTDPPYGLEFMGKGWDKFGAEIVKDVAARGGFQDGNGGNPYSRSRVAFGYGLRAMRAFGDWCEVWGREALRVTKPGGYLLAFGGTRTHHRLVCGLEDAGWLVRDELTWVYASGFPKGRANLKPAHEPIVLARKPGPLRALNIDECRIPGAVPQTVHGVSSRQGEVYGHFRDEPEPSIVNEGGRWPSNLLLSDPELFDVANPGVVGSGASASTGGLPTDERGTGGIWHEGNGVPAGPQYGDSGGYSRFFRIPEYDHGYTCAYCTIDPRPSWPDRKGFEKHMAEVHPGQPFEKDYPKAFLIPKADRADREPVLRGQISERDAGTFDGNADHSEGASRKIGSRPDIPVRPRENTHATVKPTDLMRHLVRLVTPPGGTVLDCFLGSGSTAIACELEGFPWIGIEKEPEYVAIAEARLNGVQRGLGLDVPAPTRKRTVMTEAESKERVKSYKGHATFSGGWGWETDPE